MGFNGQSRKWRYRSLGYTVKTVNTPSASADGFSGKRILSPAPVGCRDVRPMLRTKRPTRKRAAQVGPMFGSDDPSNLTEAEVFDLLKSPDLAAITSRCRFYMIAGFNVGFQSLGQTLPVFQRKGLSRACRRYLRPRFSRCSRLSLAPISAIRERAEWLAAYSVYQGDLGFKRFPFSKPISHLDHRNGAGLNDLTDDSRLMATFSARRRGVELPTATSPLAHIERLSIQAEQYVDVEIGEQCSHGLACANDRRYFIFSHVGVNSRLVRGGASVSSTSVVSLYTSNNPRKKGRAFRCQLPQTVPCAQS